MPRLIINADDLGISGGVNRAIMEAHERGVVTSATLMANSRQFGAAVPAIRDHDAYRRRRFGVGCHVVLIDGEPLSPATQIPSLLDPSTGRFRHKMSDFALAAIRGRISTHDVATETRAQIRKIQDAGIEVSHVDCHKHAHMFPAVLEGVALAAQECGVRAIRNPFEVRGTVPSRLLAANPAYGVRLAETAVLRLLYARRFAAAVRRRGLATTDGSLGITLTGALDLRSALATLKTVPAGVYELVCHPGYSDAELASAGTRLLNSRDIEFSVLTSQEMRRALAGCGFELINFWNLQ